MQYIKQKPYNFATNMLKAYLSTQSVQKQENKKTVEMQTNGMPKTM